MDFAHLNKAVFRQWWSFPEISAYTALKILLTDDIPAYTAYVYYKYAVSQLVRRI
jgi:hypothetical protein